MDPVYSLANDKMFFVNRDRAVLQLQGIHQVNYNRAVSGEGLEWMIPIADNVMGLGKSSFGNQYIQKCREAWKDVDEQTNFQKTLSVCRTVHLFFDRGDLLMPSLEAVMIVIQKAEVEFFEKSQAKVLANENLRGFRKHSGWVSAASTNLCNTITQ